MRCLSKIMCAAAAAVLFWQADIYAGNMIISDTEKTVFYKTENTSGISAAPFGAAADKDGCLIISPQAEGDVTFENGETFSVCAAEDAEISNGRATVSLEKLNMNSGKLSLTFSYNKKDILKENIVTVTDSNSEPVFQVLAAKKNSDSVYFGYKSGTSSVVSLKSKFVNINEDTDYSMSIDLDSGAVSMLAGENEIFSDAPIELSDGAAMGAIDLPEETANIKIGNAEEIVNPEFKINADKIYRDESKPVKIDTGSSIYFGDEWHDIDDKYITVTTDSDGILSGEDGLYITPEYTGDTVKIKCGVNISGTEYTDETELKVESGSSTDISENAYSQLYKRDSGYKLDIYNAGDKRTVLVYVCKYEGNALKKLNVLKIDLEEHGFTQSDIDISIGENEGAAVIIPELDYVQRTE